MPKTKKISEKNIRKGSQVKLNAVKFGLAGGIVTSICIFITTLLALSAPSYAIFSVGIIEDIYGILGYNLSFPGSLLGAIYGFIDGFILAWIFALIYNKLV